MKSDPYLSLLVVCLFSLFACRSNKKSPVHSEHVEQHTDPKSSVVPHQNEGNYGSETSPGPPKEAKDSAEIMPSWEELMKRKEEVSRKVIFAVPLEGRAALDREEAWRKLAVYERPVMLTKEQYWYAIDILDRYKEAPALEQLVFWRLVYFRLNEQGVNSISIVLDDEYNQLRLSVHPKLKALLYSALGVEHHSLEEYSAAKNGIEMLKMAGRPGDSPDN